MSIRQIILDTETTGLEPSKGHRITEIGCLEMIDRKLTGRVYHTYLNPEREIDKGAVEISGLTNEFLADKPKFHEIANEFEEFLIEHKTEIIIHNAPFDLSFLNHELGLLNHKLRPIENYADIIDTLVMARRMHPGQRNNLDALCRRYNVDNSDRRFHGALLDANLLTKVYLAMTAGQTVMSLNEETIVRQSTKQQTLKVQKVQRQNNIAIPVIRATEEELQLHQKRLLALES